MSRGAFAAGGPSGAAIPCSVVDGALAVRAQVSGRRSCAVRIPLLFAQVWCGFDAASGNAALALKTNADGMRSVSGGWPGAVVEEDEEGHRSIWLVVLPTADAASARVVLSALAEQGAILDDLVAAYELSASPFGCGGAADIFFARPRLSTAGAVAAVKIPRSGEEAGASAGVEREVEILARAQGHPNVLRLQGLFLFDAKWCIATEYCSGGDLHAAVLQEAFSEARARPVLLGILSGLAHLHGRGILHLDVKAENVLLRSDQGPVLADFGISCLKGRPAPPSSPGRVRGSPGYAAPEVISGGECSELSDVFGAGVILFFALSQSLPFGGPDVMTTLRRTLRDARVPKTGGRPLGSQTQLWPPCVLRLGGRGAQELVGELAAPSARGPADGGGGAVGPLALRRWRRR